MLAVRERVKSGYITTFFLNVFCHKKNQSLNLLKHNVVVCACLKTREVRHSTLSWNLLSRTGPPHKKSLCVVWGLQTLRFIRRKSWSHRRLLLLKRLEDTLEIIQLVAPGCRKSPLYCSWLLSQVESRTPGNKQHVSTSRIAAELFWRWPTSAQADGGDFSTLQDFHKTL